MMSTLTRNVVMVCSLAVLCAALIGCSSSGDDNSADLQRQLDMEKAARMMTEDQLADLQEQVEMLMGRAGHFAGGPRQPQDSDRDANGQGRCLAGGPR